jgi:tetratricopeptide (TPR) repeat protein
MPFGKKPLPNGQSYDFDKVYRVIIARAVREAGMKPLRADETVGSRLIHSDMFKDLRDRPVVLADLSLENPNVFYELGIRHVMSPTGTVLMCRAGTDLPFDVRLSRVIFYKFNGEELDWEEVEETVKALKLALQDAQQSQPDSPVHALLENVMKTEASHWLPTGATVSEVAEDLEKYEEALAGQWHKEGRPLGDLIGEHRHSVFGVRALGHYCLAADPPPDAAGEVANALAEAEQYALAVRIYDRLQAANLLTDHDRLRFATAYSESHPDLRGADVAIGYVRQVLDARLKAIAADDDGRAISYLAQTYHRLGGLLLWRSQLTKDGADIAPALEALSHALEQMGKARALDEFRHPGLLAQVRLRLLLLLRIRDRNAGRQDSERHRDDILKIAVRPSDRKVAVSYLHWFQAIALADLGADDQANAKALDQLAEDRKLMTEPGCGEIGRRQYVLLRRFLENYRDVLRNPRIMGRIGRHLMVGRRK